MPQTTIRKLKEFAVLMGVLSWMPAFVEATTIMLLSLGVFGFDVVTAIIKRPLSAVIVCLFPCVSQSLL